MRLLVQSIVSRAARTVSVGAALAVFAIVGMWAVSGNAFVSPLQSRQAPELASTTWINSTPLSLQELRGRVVLLEFWTYG